ncbi:nitronate monooxygenase [Sphingomonas histidinilytica]|uniref:Nitronate monooxygenase n=1 Tax=Rhizorhabdus histidinilytica TaxID=439228 RepID=A0A1T5EPX6_9SPHN|nr:nitronate monooxygenase family protein [Rhizorhabdus histidinilytica]MBO9376678.1 nitronate monooxygenase [Rhizorhabdus histidinilytica]QEH76876.1 nitronate monooxygenase [Sphingomonas sp. C8-2]SKB86032.1 nitronate monooxygenase [Rhizorhabdus histidinilytica]
MTLPRFLQDRLRLPVIGSPMFIVSNPRLVIAQCTAGIVGSFPSLSARTPELLDEWLDEIGAALAAHDAAHPGRPAAPFAVNLIVHRTNARLETDLALCEKHRVPMIITSLGARPDVYAGARAFGATVFHDVIHDGFARKAVDKGADGLIAVAAGAGGHAGALSPFALVAEIRRWFDGPLALSGAIATGAGILAAQAMGADLAYIGSPFIATEEANAPDGYKRMIVDGTADDIVYTDYFSGVRGNYLKPSIRAAGLDPDALAPGDPARTSFASGGAKVWRDIWGSGQGIGAIDAVVPAAERIGDLARGYAEARVRMGLAPR